MGSAFLEKNIIVSGERVTNASSGFDESGLRKLILFWICKVWQCKKRPMEILEDVWACFLSSRKINRSN